MNSPHSIWDFLLFGALLFVLIAWGIGGLAFAWEKWKESQSWVDEKDDIKEIFDRIRTVREKMIYRSDPENILKGDWHSGYNCATRDAIAALDGLLKDYDKSKP